MTSEATEEVSYKNNGQVMIPLSIQISAIFVFCIIVISYAGAI
jgi:hypothetical protein